MHRRTLTLVVGTRPEAIKLAPLARALAAVGLSPQLLLTGQHLSLELAEQGLDRFPSVSLACPGRLDPNEHVRMVGSAALPLLPAEGLVIVQGDTSSALGAALAASSRAIPIAHVEAGLRTHDPTQPWPEEEYRIAIDSLSDLLFAPTQISAANLRREAVGGAIHVTGNTGIDALLETVSELPSPGLSDSSPRRLLVTCHRRENWGSGLRALATATEALAGDGLQVDLLLPPNPAVAADFRRLFGNRGGARLLPPRSYRDLVDAMRRASLILSDSGGIQEEAPALGVPLLVLRDKTERPEGVLSGNARLVGTNPGRIVAAVRELLNDPKAYAAMAQPALPYGDGKAAARIAATIEEWLADPARSQPPRQPPSGQEQAPAAW